MHSALWVQMGREEDMTGWVTEGHKKREGCHQGVMGWNGWVGVTLGHEAE